MPTWLARPWLGAFACLGLATGASLLLAQILLRPTSRDLHSLAAYLALSGAATMALGWLALRLAERAPGLGIQAKVFLANLVGSGVGLLNVFIVAKLMFLSNAHDLRLLVSLLVFSGALTAFFGIWVAITTAGRIGVVAEAIRALAAARYGESIVIGGGDEVAELGGQVNELRLRLQQVEMERAALDRERRELTAGISHDLRTPLSSLRAMVDALEDRVVESPDEVDRYYSTMRREIERLSSMIDDLFELARMDAGALRLNRESVALQEIAAEVVNAVQAQATSLGLALSLSVRSEPPALFLDGMRMERAIGNLLRNAMEHTPAGGRIDVEIGVGSGWAELKVSDTGAGIGSADLPHIWDRFYRAEHSRARGPGAADGAGLGLAIVRGIVEAHGGSCEARSSPGRGTSITLHLPAGSGTARPAATMQAGGRNMASRKARTPRP